MMGKRKYALLFFIRHDAVNADLREEKKTKDQNRAESFPDQYGEIINQPRKHPRQHDENETKGDGDGHYFPFIPISHFTLIVINKKGKVREKIDQDVATIHGADGQRGKEKRQGRKCANMIVAARNVKGVDVIGQKNNFP